MADTLMARLPRRSMGLKLLLVCVLGFVMSLAALFVFLLLYDRTHRAEQVSEEIGQVVGGQQAFMGPVLAVPYVIPAAGKDDKAVFGTHVIFPVQADATAASRSEVRRRSLFKVPVWTADLTLTSTFDLTDAGALAPDRAQLDWSRAQYLVGVSDPRGARSDAVLDVGGQTRALAPASKLPFQGDSDRTGLSLLGAPAPGLQPGGAPVTVSARLAFSGAQRLSVLPWGKTTLYKARGDWPHPSFDGGFLPVSREVSDQGFQAAWKVPFIARGVPAEGDLSLISQLASNALGVTFVELTNPYQSVGRSLKYAPMFMGLVFLAFFIFETTTGRRVHPAQYVLIGLAQIVFYLLLLSIAERIGFDLAFLIAAGATVILISAYSTAVFASRRQGLIALAAFSLLYVLIYGLMRLEDLALLIGALTSFAAIAAAMFFTRRMDWYGAATPASTETRDPEPASPT